jgi:hypothetical protein
MRPTSKWSTAAAPSIHPKTSKRTSHHRPLKTQRTDSAPSSFVRLRPGSHPPFDDGCGDARQ